MNYPLISEYIEAIRSAEDNFDKLNNLRPVLDSNGNPIMSSGNFAVVFKMKDIETDKLYAVKCFTREQEEREGRYREIIKVLDEIKSPYFVSTHYYDKELFVDNTQSDDKEFPVLVMDWVEGLCLDKYMQVISDDKERRELLAQKFQKFVCWLLPKHFAHGDLKPDNIIVKDDGSLVLVDYDGMFVPSLYGKYALELGTPMFRFKDRTLDDFNEYVDDYAAVFFLLITKVNAYNAIDIDEFQPANTFECIRIMRYYVNDRCIAPLLSAYIMVSTFGRLDRQQISCLLGDNSEFDYNKELSLLNAARKGDTTAMLKLGDLYSRGKDVPESESKAIQWYELAYLLGNVNAACGLCKSYFYGDEFCNGDSLFIDMLEKNKVPFAFCRKGEELLFRDKTKAKLWFMLGAKKNFSPSKYWLANILKDEGEISNAIKLYEQSSIAGYLSSQIKLAEIFKEGEIVEKNIYKSIKWYERAGKQEDSDSLYNIGLIYYHGDSINVNYKKAVEFFRKSSALNNDEAQYMLALCYYNGHGVNQSYSDAIYWWEKAALKDNEHSLYALGKCYENGLGVDMNRNQAIYYYSKSADEGFSDAEYRLELCCKRWNIKDTVNVNPNEIKSIGECNTGSYSDDGKRFLCYRGTYEDEFKVEERTEVLCDDCFNDLYSECDGCYLKTLYLPGTLKRIGNNVFCASISEIICDTFNFYAENGFLLSSDNKTLYRYFGKEKTIHIPKGIKYIKGGAFSEKSIEKVIIPDTVIYIGDNPFAGCCSIKEIVSNSNRFPVINMTLYDVKEKRLIACWDYEASYMYIQSGIKSIGKNAFFGLNFQYVYIPDSIEVIDETSFYWCFNLCNIVIQSHKYKRTYNLIPSYIKKYVLEDNANSN